MSHSVEEYYRKIDVLHERAIELHRERYKTTGEFDENLMYIFSRRYKVFGENNS